MKFNIVAQAILDCEYKPEIEKTSVDEVSVIVESSHAPSDARYYDSNGELTEMGIRAISETFTAGVAFAIHIADKKGFINRTEHLKSIIKKIEQQIALDPKITIGPYCYPEERKCRVCGCTDSDCRNCIEKIGGPCYWVEEDLCSACQPECKNQS